MLVLLLILATVVVLGAAALIIVFARSEPVKPPEVPPVNVALVVVQPEPEVLDVSELPGVIEPERTVNVAAEVPGRVESLLLKEGARIQTGDVIVKLNTDVLQAEHDRAAAQAKYDANEADRITKLFEGGASTEREKQEKVVRAAISAAMMAESKFRLERAQIVAPISGILNRLPVETGEFVQGGTVVAQIVQMNPVKAVVEAPEKYVAYFQVGQKNDVMADVQGAQRAFPGEITYISAVADPQTRSSRLEITVPNAEGLLRSGQIVRVRLIRRVLRDVIMVPLAAIIPMEEGKRIFVAVEKPGEAGASVTVAEGRDVELGIIKGTSVQVLTGLKAGDRLIVSGHRFVGPGQTVRVVAQPVVPEADAGQALPSVDAASPANATSTQP